MAAKRLPLRYPGRGLPLSRRPLPERAAVRPAPLESRVAYWQHDDRGSLKQTV